MMPAFVEALLRGLSAAVFLSLVVVFLVAWPARHVLEPLWLAPVEERLYMNSEGGVDRVFAAIRRADVASVNDRLLTRDRPLSLARVELISGDARHGYLLGVRSGPDQSLDDGIPEWLLATIVEPRVAGSGILVLVTADEQTMEFPAGEVRRLIYPNRASITERLDLFWRRFVGQIAERLPESVVQLVSDDTREETR